MANILHIEGAVALRLASDGSVSASVHSGTNGASSIAVNTGIVFNQSQQWALVALSFDAADGSLSVWGKSESSSIATATQSSPGFSVGPAGPSIHIGAVDSMPAMHGVYGLIAVRDHIIEESDFLHLWEHRRHHGPYSAMGGSLTGTSGCVWMINHAMTTRPVHVDAGGEPHQWAAIVNEPVTRFNMHIFDVTQPQGTSLRAVRAVHAALGFVHRSPYEGHDFFVRTLPEISDSFPQPPHWRAHVSPKARLLATNLPQGIGLFRVLASANSRGIQAGDGSATGTGNFAHGFVLINLERTAGVLNRPARIDAGPWFGFDASEHNPYHVGDITELRFTDFSRFWTSAHVTTSFGPGQGVHLKPGAAFAMRCRPQGMIEATQPLLVQAHLLRFPGASNVLWTANKHSRQGQPGTDVGEAASKPLDTTTWSHQLQTAAGDEVINSTRIALVGDHRNHFSVGDACHIGGGSGGSLSVISAVIFDGQRTVIDFEHPFSGSPADGSLLRFGPWEFTTVWHLWPGLSGADPDIWRGLKLTAGASGGGEGLVLFSFDAWRPGVDGFVFGVAGWGGMGYEQHIKRSFSGVTGAWASQLNIDVWLQIFATQLSHASWMDIYTAEVRSGLPDVEVLWLGDVDHPSNWDSELWHWWILNFAQQNQVASATVRQHADLGAQLDLLGDGLRSDELHLTQRGNQRLADLWTEMLLDAALPGPLPTVGDLNGDGNVDISDLLLLLGSWGMCDNPNTCSGDLNGDGSVDLSDLLLLLGNWG